MATGVATVVVADDDVQPAPPSIGADVPVTYFGPAPSSVEKELIGPYQLMKSGTIDFEAGTITMPLYRGRMADDGAPVWYVVTDSSDAANAEALGINHSGKLAFADTCRGARSAELENGGDLVFQAGRVDFSPQHVVEPGDAPSFFPPVTAEPGAVGDEFYSPLVAVENAGGQIYNAPIVAFGADAEDLSFCDGDPDYDLVHDKVVRFCPEEGTVTLQLTTGFSFARPVFYLSLDANDPLPAALESATFAPALRDVDVGRDDSLFSAVERIFVFANGPTGVDNPQRQGLDSALSDGRGPLNVLGGIPTIATDYSPLWDMNLGEWTQAAVDAGYRARLTEEFQILGFVQRGFITGPNGAPYGSTGYVVNCPIVHRFL